MWMFSTLNYAKSRPFVLIRLHHLGHWRGDLNSELFLVNKKYQKLLKHTQSRQKLKYLKTTRLLLFIESTNKMFVNYIPTGPVKSNTIHINKIHACDVFNNAIPRINVWVTLLAYKISGYLRKTGWPRKYSSCYCSLPLQFNAVIWK